jgi:hypothetical protein
LNALNADLRPVRDARVIQGLVDRLVRVAVLSVFAIPTSAGLTGASVAAGTTVGVIAKVKGKGIFGDDTSFETPVYEIPVTICNGCVGNITCPDPTQTVVALCPPNDGQLPTGAPACQ